MKTNQKRIEKKKSRRVFYRMLKGQGGWFLACILAAVFAALFSLLIPMVSRYTVDCVLDTQRMDLPKFLADLIENIGGREFLRGNLWVCGLVVVLFAAGNAISSLLRTYCSRTGAEGLAKTLRDSLMDQYQSLPFSAYHNMDTGDIIQRCTSDVNLIRDFAAGRVVELVRAIAIVTIAFLLMLTGERKMLFATMSLIPLVLAASIVYFRSVQEHFLVADEAEGEMSSVLQENLAGVRVVRAFGQEKREVEKFNEKNEKCTREALRVADNMALYWGMTDAAGYVEGGISLAVGTIMCLKGELSIGQLIMFTSYATMLVWPVRQMGRILADFGKSKVAWARLYDVLSRDSEDDGGELTFRSGDIVFENVCFGYDKEHELLHDISFRVKAGQTVALLGRTGSGKSSLIALLARLHDPTSGRILVDGQELSETSRRSVRENVGIVLQESFLYSRTLRENIAVTDPDASDEAVNRAADDAALTEVIRGFPEGYGTEIGERGITLSGGQKQRVAIARTLLRKTPVLILDDSLSAVDTRTDALIRARLAARENKPTTFLISHRIGTLMQADLILVLENGRIGQMGTAEELLKQDGLFRDLFDIQAERRRQEVEA